MTATETHSSSHVEQSGYEEDLMEDSMVASKLGLPMWSTGKIHQDNFAGELSTMEHPPHENPVLAATDRMHYKWFKSKAERASGNQEITHTTQGKYCSGGGHGL
ncbi:MAG: hypothetical protein ACKPKO_27840, partial [Candidatus Fonsibacter sp.]